MSASNVVNQVTTPLGEVHLRVRYDGEFIQAESEECLIELKMLDTAMVEAAYLAEVHLAPTRSVSQLQVHCRWEASITLGRARPEPSAGKNALRWASESHILVIASDDVEALKRCPRLPSRIRSVLTEITPELDHLVFEYRDDGLIVRLSDLGKGETIGLKFLIVWDRLPERSQEGIRSFVASEVW